MRFQTLFSGSKGNCAFLQTQNNKILIDCGSPASTIEKSLAGCGVYADEIDAVFITHEHSDHISGLKAFCAKHKADVFAHESCAMQIQSLLPRGKSVSTFNGAPFAFRDLKIDTYDCPHDSMSCTGFRFTNGSGSIAIVTDLGEVQEDFLPFVGGCDLLVLESNHDEKMLAQGSYPFALKKRIAGKYGHLSNRQAAEVLKKLPDLNVGEVWLGHLSLQNNTPEIAFRSAVETLALAGIKEGKDIVVQTVGQFSASRAFVK